MSAIDTLRDITRDRYDTEVTLVRCQTINDIADEIENEINELRCKVEHVDWRLVASEILNKPADENIQSITEWLEKWYIPRPVDADGELFDFNKIYDNGCGAIGRIYLSEFPIEDGKTLVIYNIVSHDEVRYAPNTLRAEEPDSIEKLRKDICCAVGGCVIGFYRDFEAACKDCDVTEFVARAEKLFKEDAE